MMKTRPHGISSVEEKLGQMVEDYLEQTGASVDVGGLTTLADEEKGFVRFAVGPDAIWIQDLYGDGRYWIRRLEEIAREEGVPRLMGGTHLERVNALCRVLGTKKVGYIIAREVE